MNIQFSYAQPDTDRLVRQAARMAHCVAAIKWAEPYECRFTLHASANDLRSATSAQHDAVIAALLDVDVDARIRTAKATYNGRDDYRRQNGA